MTLTLELDPAIEHLLLALVADFNRRHPHIVTTPQEYAMTALAAWLTVHGEKVVAERDA